MCFILDGGKIQVFQASVLSLKKNRVVCGVYEWKIALSTLYMTEVKFVVFEVCSLSLEENEGVHVVYE